MDTVGAGKDGVNSASINMLRRGLGVSVWGACAICNAKAARDSCRERRGGERLSHSKPQDPRATALDGASQ
jgi:hypothetical protein